MTDVNRLLTVGGTILCALSIGYVMQNSAEPAPRAVSVNSVKNQAPSEKGGAVAAFTEAMLTSTAPVAQTATIRSQSLTNTQPKQVSVSNDSSGAMSSKGGLSKPNCETNLKAQPVSSAMVSLEITAPCTKNELFTVHHNGMMFTEVTDANGVSKIIVPALSEYATFIISFASGRSAVTTTHVDSLKDYHRAVVQWNGGDGLFVNRAGFQLDRTDPQYFLNSAAEADARLGDGFLTHHGTLDTTKPLLARVITLPKGSNDTAADQLLRVESEITAANCGREVSVQSIRILDDRALQAREVMLTMPGCSAIGGIRVLKNLFNDQTIVRN